MGGSGPMAGFLAKLGNVTMSTVVDSVERWTLRNVTTEDVGNVPDAGAVSVLYGSSAGLSTAGAQTFVQPVSAVEVDDLAVGDWDAHELVTRAARAQASLDQDDWDASHVTLPDGEVAEVPAGL